MLSTFLSSLRSQNLSIYSSPSRQSVLPRSIRVPDFFGAIPDAASEFRVNELCREVADESEEWFRETVIGGGNAFEFERGGAGDGDDKEERLSVFERLKPSLLAACLFPGAGRIQLRLCSDLLVCLMLMENEAGRSEQMNGERETGASVSRIGAAEGTRYRKGLQEYLSSRQWTS